VLKKRKAKILTLIFDDTVPCKKGILGLGDQVQSGESIKEKEYVQFSAQLEDGKIVQNWYLNDKEQKYETSKTFSYKVDQKDADSDAIDVSFTLK